GMLFTLSARLSSEFSSRYTSYSQPWPVTNGRTLLDRRLSSIDTATIFTPVSSCQSIYISLMALSSRIQGLHQVAQKLITIGFPSLLRVEASTWFPPRSFTWMDGSFSWAIRLAENRSPSNSVEKSLFIRNVI